MGVVTVIDIKMASKRKLPIASYRECLVKSIKENHCIVVTGETGCGKTTQLPQYLYWAGLSEGGMIGITQPRRMAAISVANRVSDEMNTRLGGLVGYQVRFDDCTSSDTKLKYMTDGCLLRELLDDPFLSSYSVIILDEAHERSLATDILFGLTKKLLPSHRPLDQPRDRPLKLIIMSATLDVKRFSEFFDNCPIFRIPGRLHPVSIHYTFTDETFDPAKTSYLSRVEQVVMDTHLDKGVGDILVFLTGQQEIESMCNKLFKAAERIDYEYDVQCKEVVGLAILPLYGSLPTEQQQRIFKQHDKGVRRVIVSTNIAATSVTVDGVVYVIDSGYVKQLSFNPRTGLDVLAVVPISKSEAEQRAGRAGRTEPGQCHRLYSQSFYQSMIENTVPEIQRASLSSVILDFKCMAITNVIEFDYLDPPEERMIAEALKQLYYFEAIDDKGHVTELGRQLVQFPLQPSLARAVIKSKSLDCAEAVLPIVAMLSVENVFIRPNTKKEGEEAMEAHRILQEAGGGTSDYATLLATYKLSLEASNQRKWCRDHYIHWRSLKTAHSIVSQLKSIVNKQEIKRGRDEEVSTPLSERVRQSLCYGLFCNTARLAPSKRSFRTMDGHSTIAYIHPGSALFGCEDSLDWIIYHEIVDTAKTYLRTICPVRYGWVKDLLPRLHEVDAYKLSACERRRSESDHKEKREEPVAKKQALEREEEKQENSKKLREKAEAARERYLSRKNNKQ